MRSPRASTESAITATICRRLRLHGVWHVKLHGSPMQRRGLPDLLVVRNGQAFFFEVKRPGCRPTRLQAHRLDECRRAGAVAQVVTSWGEAERTLGLA